MKQRSRIKGSYMNKKTLLWFLMGFAFLALYLIPSNSVMAADQEPFAGEALCLPDVYVSTPDGCLPLGPSSFLTTMAEKGIPIPTQPLPVYNPDPSLIYTALPYIKVGDNAFPLYSSLDSAISRSPATMLDAGMKYLAIIDKQEADNGIYYQLANGYWVEAGEAYTECCIRSGRFQGLFFYQNPVNSFGWIVDQAVVFSAPGYNSPQTGQTLNRESLVQIYDTAEADGTTWYMLGWDQWVERRKIRQFHINLTPPDGVDNQRWIEINLYEQTLGIYDHGKLVFATLIASGSDPFYTQPGLFQIYEKLDKTDMSGAFEADRSDYYYLQDVPWTMYYDEARALHGAYWRTLFGYPQSHGCVNLSVGDSRIVYDWADVGDWVYVWDPSGETPTDPDYYGAGGA